MFSISAKYISPSEAEFNVEFKSAIILIKD